MKNILKLLCAAAVLVGIFSSCKTEPQKNLKLSADKASVTADGVDKITFTVTYGDETITGAEIKSGDIVVKDNTFTTEKADTYTFVATFKGATSNDVTVTATAKPKPVHKLELTPSKTTVTADGKDEVTFTVKFDGNDVTDKSSVCIVGKMCLPNPPVFTTKDAGEYKLYATYAIDGSADNEIKSDEITITAVKAITHTLVLSLDKKWIKADGADEVKFTVMLEGKENVTGKSKIYDSNDKELPTNIFTTTTVGDHLFYATYTPEGGDMVKSGKATVHADDAIDNFDPAKTIKKNVSFFFVTATWCGPCYLTKSSMKKLVEKHGDNVVQLQLHIGSDAITQKSFHPSLNKINSHIGKDGRFASEYIPNALIEFEENIVGGVNDNGLEVRYDSYIGKPVKTGIKVKSEIVEGKVDVKVTIGAKEAGEYAISVFLVEDHIKATQNGYGSNYDHTNVARQMGTKEFFGDALGSMTAGQTVDKLYSFDALSAYNPDNLSVMVYVTRKKTDGNDDDKNKGKMVIDSARKVSANATADYDYVN